MPWAVVAKLGWLLQLGLLIHVFKTGRPYWWFWILFSAPLIGGLVYFAVEILPGLRGVDGLSWSGLKPRAWRIRELRAQLEETDIVQTRLRLADEILAAGQPAEAHAIAVAALEGAFRDDPRTLTDVARFKIEAGDFRGAHALLENVRTQADRRLAVQVALLRGRALLGLQRAAEAEPHLAAARDSFLGEEPRFHLADVFAATGRRPEAVESWHAILKRFRKGTPAWRRSERRWYRLAKLRLAQQAR